MSFEQIKMLTEFDLHQKNIHLISVHSDEIVKFNQYFQFIKKRVDQFEDDELSESFLFLRLLFNKIRSSIDPYNEVLEKENLKNVMRFFTELKDADYKEETTLIVKQLWNLINSFKKGEVENELRKKLSLLYSQETGRKVVVLNSFLNSNTHTYKTIKINQYLTGNYYYDQVFFLGSPNYYPQQNTVFKATNTYFLIYDIYRSEMKKIKLIQDNEKENCKLYSDVFFFRHGREFINAKDEGIEIISNESALSLNNWLKSYSEKRNKMSETSLARVIELVTGEYIFFPIKSKVKTFDKEKKVIKEVSLSEITQGDWIVIKKSSDEEYIRQKARDLIGTDYENIVGRVTRYKKELLRFADEFHLDIRGLSKVLQKNGIDVQIQSLNQWINGNTIAPRNYKAILVFLNYDAESINQLEREYHKILKAHQYAGRELVKNIQSLIKTVDSKLIFEQMTKYNTFDFEVEKMGEFCIKEVSFINNDQTVIDSGDLYRIWG